MTPTRSTPTFTQPARTATGARRLAVAASAALAMLAACGVGTIEGRLDGDDDDTVGDPPPPPPPPLPPAAVYQRGSLSPVFELVPRAEYGKFVHNGVTMSDADFAVAGNGFVAAGQKLDELASQIAQERGLPVPPTLMRKVEDRQRAQTIPFRGNPSDVAFTDVGGVTRAFVPLGGDLTIPGNEVAIAAVDGSFVTRVRVGLRPQRVEAHASGLVFVCNQFSNYISIIDSATSSLLRTAEGPVEIATDYYCSDLLLVERNPLAQDVDAVDLYVANQFRASVLRYGLEIIRDPLTDRPIDVRLVEPAVPEPANEPAVEITGVGSNPNRLTLSESQDAIYVANSRGGELSRISIARQEAVARVALGSPSVDAVQIGDSVFVPTLMPDRGLLSREEPVVPQQVLAPPSVVTGLDGQPHEAHPGSLFDGTRAYNFDDTRNGLFALSFLLTGSAPVYFTDDISPEANFAAQQKVLAGAVPQAVARNRAGDRIYLAMSGSDLVQELVVRAGAFRVTNAGGRVFATRQRPFAMAVNDDAGELYVATWGGETLDVIDLASGQRTRSIDLGYAVPAYPATNIEHGEYWYYNADWSNNGRKSCASCHLDELVDDGFSFSNGATAPTTYHRVPSSFNLMTTDSFFWNGSFSNGTYTSLATAAQTRTNCETIAFATIEGPGSDPATRVGDPNNRVTDGQDDRCRPIVGPPNTLPENFADIAAVIASQKEVAAALIEQETGYDRQTVARYVDFWEVGEMRLPPNPLHQMYQYGELDASTTDTLERGKQLFASAGCGNCHRPDNERAPFTDNLNHGAGADWAQRFVSTYFADPRIMNTLGGIPQPMLEGITESTPDSEINIHTPLDAFTPFCFDSTSCLTFQDPLAVRGVEPAESDRLALIIAINLADPDRGFVPGYVPGQPVVNTSSLRATWWRSNYLHHGMAHSIAEAILAPGHPGLRDGERGYAVNALGEVDVHGVTSDLSVADVEALVLYVLSIE